jgi:rubrerythrin
MEQANFEQDGVHRTERERLNRSRNPTPEYVCEQCGIDFRRWGDHPRCPLCGHCARGLPRERILD